MSGAGTRVGVGSRFRYDGEGVEVVELAASAAGNEVVLRDGRGRVLRISLRELLFSDRAVIIPEVVGPASDDADKQLAGIVLGQVDEPGRRSLVERAEHVREVLTGDRCGTAELAREGEPRAQYDPALPLGARYAAKAQELGVGLRSVKRWVAQYRETALQFPPWPPPPPTSAPVRVCSVCSSSGWSATSAHPSTTAPTPCAPVAPHRP